MTIEANYGKILISELECECIIGIHKDERIVAQKVFISLELSGDFSLAASSDNIKDTVDYDSLSKKICSYLRRKKFHLLEAAATQICNLCLENELIGKVSVEIKKPDALINSNYVSFLATKDK